MFDSYNKKQVNIIDGINFPDLSSEVPPFRSYEVQTSLVISTSLITNNRFSRSEKEVPVLTCKSNNR